LILISSRDVVRTYIIIQSVERGLTVCVEGQYVYTCRRVDRAYIQFIIVGYI